jgi:hypothetical protein
MTKDEAQTLAVVVERLDGVKEDTQEIKEHLKTLNGKVNDTCIKLAKTDEIAKAAEKQSSSNGKNIIGLYVAVIAIGAGVIAAFIQRGGG